MTAQKTLFEIIEQLYADALAGRDWSSALGAMSTLFGAVGVSYEVFDKKRKAPIELQLTSDVPDPPRAEYMDYYGQISPRFHDGFGKPAGYVSFDYNILSERDMERDEFYSDLMAPLGLRYFISANILETESHHSVIAVQRSRQQGHVDNDDIERMHVLAPHLRQAGELRYRLGAADRQIWQLQNTIDQLSEGCLILSKTGLILHHNACAEQIFDDADGLRTEHKQLHLEDKAAAQKYLKCLADISTFNAAAAIGSVRDFIVQRPSGKLPYLISIRPLPATSEVRTLHDHGAVIVFIRDPNTHVKLNIDMLSEVFDLSNAEADIAICLDQGLTLEEIRRERGVSITTVRSQLYSLMAKLGVRRQAHLMRRLAQFRVPFV
ncbi:MAG: LuxR C-terminal-related transcriptional regulator [Pseudomonadota bacterium]